MENLKQSNIKKFEKRYVHKEEDKFKVEVYSQNTEICLIPKEIDNNVRKVAVGSS